MEKLSPDSNNLSAEKLASELKSISAEPDFESRVHNVCQTFDQVTKIDFADLPLLSQKWVGKSASSLRMRQLMAERVINRGYMRVYLLTQLFQLEKDAVDGPLGAPSVWRKFLLPNMQWKQNLISRYCYSMDVLWFFTGGVKQFVSCFLYSVGKNRKSQRQNLKGSHVLVNFPLKSVPQNNNESYSETFVEWHNKFLNDKNFEYTFSGISLNNGPYAYDSIQFPFLPLKGIKEFTYFIARSIYILCSSLLGIFTGRAGLAILSRDMIQLAFVKSLNPESIATSYIFNNSDWMQKPLWTSYVESKGGEVSLAYYSSNTSIIYYGKTNIKDPIFGFNLIYWKKYIVWTKNQEIQIKKSNKLNKESEFIVARFIPFLREPTKTSKETKKFSIAVFDVTPVQLQELMKIGMYSSYYTSQNIIKFLEDIVALSIKLGFHIYIKPKRLNRKSQDSGYSEYIDHLREMENVTVVRSETSPMGVLAVCDASISFPFTSTGLISRHMQKPSLYYDPTGDVSNVNNIHERVAYAGNETDLEKWLLDIMGQDQVDRAALTRP